MLLQITIGLIEIRGSYTKMQDREGKLNHENKRLSILTRSRENITMIYVRDMLRRNEIP